MMLMWERLEKPWKRCFEIAWETYCHGSFPIGAVVVNKNGDIISEGKLYFNERGIKIVKKFIKVSGLSLMIMFLFLIINSTYIYMERGLGLCCQRYAYKQVLIYVRFNVLKYYHRLFHRSLVCYKQNWQDHCCLIVLWNMG